MYKYLMMLYFIPGFICTVSGNSNTFSYSYLRPADSVSSNAFRDSARMALKEGNYIKSAQYYSKAAAIFLSGENFEKYIDMLSLEADSYRRAGNFNLAEQTARKSINACENYLQTPQTRTANAYHTLGVIKDYQGLPDEAAVINEQALAILLKISQEPSTHVGDIYNSLGVNYLNRGDYYRALEKFSEALDIFREHLDADNQRIADMYLNISSVYIGLGNYRLAQEYLEQELSITTKNMGPDHPYVAETCTNLGSAYARLGDFDQAKAYFERSLEIAEHHFGETSLYTIDGNHNLANLHSEQGNSEIALRYFNRTIGIIAQNFGKNHVEMGKIYHAISRHYLKFDQLDFARDYGEQSLAILQNILGEKNLLVAKSYLALAKTEKAYGDLEQALNYCQSGLIANVKEFSESDLSKNPTTVDSFNPGTNLSLLDLKSDLLDEQYHKNNDIQLLEQALACLQLADQLTDAIQREQVPFEDKLSQTEETDFVYKKLVRTSYQLYSAIGDDEYLKMAFHYADKSKAALLKRAIAEDAAKSFGNIPDSLLVVERNLKADQNYYRTRIALEQSEKQPDSLTIVQYQGKLFASSRKYDSLILALEEQYPRYFQLKYSEPELDLNQLQANLTGHTVVEYFYADDQLFTFVVNERKYYAVLTPIKEDFSGLINSLREHLSSSGSRDDFLTVAESLYQVLISPVESFLEEGNRLTIIPHGLLAIIPFDILIKPSSDQTSINITNADYLLNHFPVTYAFSINSMADYQQEAGRWQARFAGFAPANQNAFLAQSETLEPYGTLRNQLVELAYTQEEITSAATYFGQSEIFTNEEASEKNFKMMSGKYQVLHLAMHAIVDQENPLLSKLIFTPADTMSSEDGYLLAREIYDLNLNADLTVLSACNTGFGKHVGGEGVMSLGRAFAYAGCPSIVMSLWPAQDQATARLMNLFYDGLSNGLSKDQALRNAKIQYLGTADDLFSHPFYWANFIVQGNPEPLYEHSNTNLIGLISIALVLLLLVIIWWKRPGIFSIKL